MTDDGRGIADPQTLLSFGKSGWSQDVCSSEDPAGMGFFSLARRNASVESRPAGGDAWRIDLEPEHFRGGRPAQVHPGADAPARHGTRITFSRRQHERDIGNEIANAARHCPLAVSVDGKAVEHEDFLEHAIRVSEYEGVRIGVFHGADKRDPKSTAFPNIGSINFHGLAVACPELPRVVPISERGGSIAKAWSTAVDIVDCPDLELVLPARHKAVDNEFLRRLAEACRRAIYHAILEHGRDTRLARVDQLEALVDEIPVPEPPPELKPWEPGTREEDYTGRNWTGTGTKPVYGSAGWSWRPAPTTGPDRSQPAPSSARGCSNRCSSPSPLTRATAGTTSSTASPASASPPRAAARPKRSWATSPTGPKSTWARAPGSTGSP